MTKPDRTLSVKDFVPIKVAPTRAPLTFQAGRSYSGWSCLALLKLGLINHRIVEILNRNPWGG